MSEPMQAVAGRLAELAEVVERLPDGPERFELGRGLAGLRGDLERLHEAEREQRHQFGHDLRVPLNAIAGWVHILRLDAPAGDLARRAVDVFDRNVRALTRLIETYTAEGDR